MKIPKYAAPAVRGLSSLTIHASEEMRLRKSNFVAQDAIFREVYEKEETKIFSILILFQTTKLLSFEHLWQCQMSEKTVFLLNPV